MMSNAKNDIGVETERGMIGIVGLGNVGMNILQTFAQAGKNVLGVEVDASNVGRYPKRTEENLAGLVAKGKMVTDERDAVIERMCVSACLDDLEASAVCYRARDRMEGIRAFAEKRKTDWLKNVSTDWLLTSCRCHLAPMISAGI